MAYKHKAMTQLSKMIMNGEVSPDINIRLLVRKDRIARLYLEERKIKHQHNTKQQY
jgi:hypothetical protein